MYKSRFRQKRKRSRSPAGPRRLRDSDTHKRIAVPQALCVRQECLRPRPKSGKVRLSDTRPGDVGERVERSEGSDSGPVRKAPVSACVPLCAIFLGKPSVYPLSPAKANVGHLWEKLKIGMRNGWGQSCGGIFADFFSSADGEGSQRTGKCMYIKAWQNKRDFTGGTKPHCGRGREGPVFRRVCPCVRSFSEGRV